jgi:dTDP-4-dehydrorhamnose 3,5-epimerase
MKVRETSLHGLLLIEADCFGDKRGFFMETWQKRRYRNFGIAEDFVQDNLSYSERGVLRGLHFQNPQSQGKLVYVIKGEVYDVVVDIRKGSPTYGKWEGYYLSEENHRQLYIPPGFAHGFCVTGINALFAYKCSDYYNKETEKGLIWNDPDIGINWPLDVPELSDKDLVLPRLRDYKKDQLPGNAVLKADQKYSFQERKTSW